MNPTLAGRKPLPRGINVLQDVLNEFPDYVFTEIFDVGACTGQSAKQFLSAFPNANVTCFEPTEESFALLCSKVRAYGNVRCFQLGLGAYSGPATLIVAEKAYMNRLVKQELGASSVGELDESAVTVTTLDEHCRDNDIAHISFLKIDTEGWDLDVLKGGSELLKSGNVDWVQVEAGMNPENQLHVPMEELKAYLEALSYRLFGIYEQVNEWPTNQAHLRRANLLFASPVILHNG